MIARLPTAVAAGWKLGGGGGLGVVGGGRWGVGVEGSNG